MKTESPALNVRSKSSVGTPLNVTVSVSLNPSWTNNDFKEELAATDTLRGVCPDTMMLTLIIFLIVIYIFSVWRTEPR